MGTVEWLVGIRDALRIYGQGGEVEERKCSLVKHTYMWFIHIDTNGVHASLV